MSDKNTGGQAFPQQMIETDGGHNSVAEWGAGGMDLRDWFAGLVIQGIVSTSHAGMLSPTRWSVVAYQMADAMIEQRNK